MIGHVQTSTSISRYQARVVRKDAVAVVWSAKTRLLWCGPQRRGCCGVVRKAVERRGCYCLIRLQSLVHRLFANASNVEMDIQAMDGADSGKATQFPLAGSFRTDGLDLTALAGTAGRPPILRPVELTLCDGPVNIDILISSFIFNQHFSICFLYSLNMETRRLFGAAICFYYPTSLIKQMWASPCHMPMQPTPCEGYMASHGCTTWIKGLIHVISHRRQRSPCFSRLLNDNKPY